MVSAERLRLDEADTGGVPWRRWDPYLSERQWGTVREDYGSRDDTSSCFSHEQARSRSWQLTGILGPNVFERDGAELASPGLFADLGPWQFHLVALQ